MHEIPVPRSPLGNEFEWQTDFCRPPGFQPLLHCKEFDFKAETPLDCLQREGGMPETNKELRARLSEKAFMSHFNIESQRA